MGTFYVMGHKLELIKLSTLKDMKERMERYEKRYGPALIREKARADGLDNIPATDQKETSAYEQELAHSAQKLASHIVSIYRGALELLDAKIKTEQELLELSYKDARSNIEQLHSLEEQAVDNAHSLKDAHKHLEHMEERYHSLSKKLGRGPVQYIPHWLYIIFALLIFLGEIPLNALVFEMFGENQVMTWVMAFIIGLSVPLVAHFVGIKAREHGDGFHIGNAFKAVLGSAVVIAALYGLAIMRVSYLRSNQEDLGLSTSLIDSSFLFFWLNVAVFFAACMIAYLSHDAVPGYEAAEKQFKQARRRVEKLERKRVAILRKIGREKLEALRKTNNEYREGMSRVHMMYGAYDQLLHDGQEHEQRCYDRLKRQVTIYRDENLKARSGDGLPQSFKGDPEFTFKLRDMKEKLLNDDIKFPEI